MVTSWKISLGADFINCFLSICFDITLMTTWSQETTCKGNKMTRTWATGMQRGLVKTIKRYRILTLKSVIWKLLRKNWGKTADHKMVRNNFCKKNAAMILGCTRKFPGEITKPVNSAKHPLGITWSILFKSHSGEVRLESACGKSKSGKRYEKNVLWEETFKSMFYLIK